MGRGRRGRRGRATQATHAAAPLLAWSLAGCSTPDLPDEPPSAPPPEALDAPAFDFSTGDGDVAGDYFLRVEEWRTADGGRSVVLLPVIHLADAAFYAEIEQRLADADVVLTEGVGGPPALSPTSLLVEYVVGNYSRGAWLGGLVPQSLALDEGPRAESGDLEQSEFAAATSCGDLLFQAAVLPILIVLVEPIHLLRWLEAGGRTLVGDATGDEAGFRHWVTDGHLGADDDAPSDSDDGLLAGVISTRNARLLDRLDDCFARPDVDRIAIPWGADHMPEVSAALAERGFTRASAEWLRAVAVAGHLREPDVDRNGGWHAYVPYLLDAQQGPRGSSCGVACDALAIASTDTNPFALALLWGFVARVEIGGERGESGCSVLPTLFGRPLLFDWRRHGDSHRVRFLWFFEFGQ
jgi:hypothetical protein